MDMEAAMKRIPPHSAEAEQAVLGAMLMNKEAITVASEILSGDDFYQTAYGILFNSMVELFHAGKPVDLITLQEYLKEYPIFCVPLVVTSGTESYRDNIDITVETIYARQKNENFKTSLPRPQDIEDVYSAIARQGYTHVIVLMIAECLSSANNLMRLAAEEHPELTVKVFDSKSASIGLGALAVQVARYAVRGVAFDPLCELTKRLIDDTVVYFSLDTLEYLQRGGRIGRATALAGGLLQIKPILTFDRKDGMISTAAKVRGRRGVQQRLIELATELAAKHPGEEYNLVVCDGNVPEEGAALEAALTRALPNAHRVLHGKIDATLAVHLGPNLLGVGVQFLNSKLPA